MAQLINILIENQDTVTVGENISEESENVDVRFVDSFFLSGLFARYPRYLHLVMR